MKKILIVDDMQIIVMTLKEILKDRYEILTAHNYQDASRICREHEIEIIITDVNLNDFKDGIQFIAELKENNPGLIAFICSGEWKYGEKVRTMFRDDELVRFLEKPVDFLKFPQHIETALAKRDEKNAASK